MRQRKREGEWLKKGRESERGWKKRERENRKKEGSKLKSVSDSLSALMNFLVKKSLKSR